MPHILAKTGAYLLGGLLYMSLLKNNIGVKLNLDANGRHYL